MAKYYGIIFTFNRPRYFSSMLKCTRFLPVQRIDPIRILTFIVSFVIIYNIYVLIVAITGKETNHQIHISWLLVTIHLLVQIYIEWPKTFYSNIHKCNIFLIFPIWSCYDLIVLDRLGCRGGSTEQAASVLNPC